MPFNAEQELATFSKFDKDVLVSAGAGSGKTQVLTTRGYELIKSGIDPRQLLLLTFTEAAAAEMKGRIKKKIQEDESLHYILPLVNDMQVTTFDAFNQFIVKKYFYRLNLSRDFSICDSIVMQQKKIDIINLILEEYYRTLPQDFKYYVDHFIEKDDKVLVETLLSMISKIDLYPSSLDFLNNYSKNYINDEFKNIIKEAYDYVFNIHTNKLKGFYQDMKAITSREKNINILNELIYVLENGTHDEICESLKKTIRFQLVKEVDKTEEDFIFEKKKKDCTDYKKKFTDFIRFTFEEYYDFYESTVNSQKLFVNILTDYYKKVDSFKHEYQIFEFNDIQKFAIKLLKENEDIKEELKAQYKEILIDEYQDTSDLQEEFISLFMNNNRFMVGDIKQSIYRFRNANPDIFKQKYLEFYPITKANYNKENKELKNQKGYLIDMNQNFRSRQEVLNGINEIFNTFMTEDFGDAKYKESHQMRFGLTSYLDVETGLKTNDTLIIKYDTLDKKIDKDRLEAYLIAKDILSKVNKIYVNDKNDGKRKALFKDFCILIDNGNKFDIVKKVLEYFKIPVAIKQDIKIEESDVSNVIVNMMNLVSKSYLKEYDSDYYHYLTSVLRSFIYNMQDNDIYNIVRNKNKENDASIKALELSKLIDKISLKDLYTNILNTYNFYQNVIRMKDVDKSLHEAEFMYQKLEDLTNLKYTFYEASEKLKDIISSDNTFKYSIDNSDMDAVKLMNIHKSKGLEFAYVYFPYLSHKYNDQDIKKSDGISKKYGMYLPIYSEKYGLMSPIIKKLVENEERKKLESERVRLFYVALTRAREQMIFIKDIKEDQNEDIKKSFASYLNYVESNNGECLKNQVVVNDLEEFINIDFDQAKEHNEFKGHISLKYDDINFINNEIKEDHVSKQSFKLLDDVTYKNMNQGTYLHEALEMMDFSKSKEENLNKSLLSDELKGILDKVLDLDIMKNLKDASTYHEYEFLSIIDGKKFNGIIDLLAVYKDHVDIIDYKLKNFDDEAYDRQLSIYASFIRTKTDKPINCYLLSLINHDVRKVKVDI